MVGEIRTKNFALIISGQVHQIIQSEEKLDWPPDSQGNPLLFVECNENVQEGWLYNSDMETLLEPPEMEPPLPESITLSPTADDLYQAATLLNQAEIIANQRQQDKVIAAILLEQVGGEANV